ncbi:hypothetical protein H072_1877 [Dactylellina haptotyla CBS 200.50]|uniref:Glucose-methanol-choline oxidoreductase N-terminal domain-containing protein n=1 Tax=Dactylellina haptotyla (strain CBS 200.50) TaxID=1284197 RepID=S8BXF6_DACHA|nr:hypothetical protein H072_1877 [Dactylellina haptotyla CBS 200.50]
MYVNTLCAPFLSLLLLLLGNGVEALPKPGGGGGYPPPNPGAQFAARTYDYIIVGGGTAGLVVANRLSCNPNIKVGVLEAGPNGLDDPLIYVPGKVGQAVGTKYDWNFTSTAQPILGNRTIGWARGRALGGSSAINFYVWMRGNRQDYDAWANLGNLGWDFNSMVPFFKKPEHFHVPSSMDAADFDLTYVTSDHGLTGPIDTSYSVTYGGSHQYWKDTLNNLNLPARDIFGGSNWGVWTGLTSVKPSNRTRSYSASGYYRPFSNRPNLHVLCEAMVKEVTLGYKYGQLTATGVRFTYKGSTYNVQATEEVIVSAGSVQSPQILELSGIGNPSVLAAANIPLKYANSKVGEQLQDRIMTVMIYEILSNVSNQDPLLTTAGLAEAQAEYDTYHTGLLTVVPTDFAYVPLKYYLNETYTNYLSTLVTGNDSRTDNIKSKLNYTLELGSMEFVFDPNQLFPVVPQEAGKKYGTVFQMLQYPFSTGNVHIPPAPGPGLKTDSSTPPIINPKYYEGDGVVDMYTMAAGNVFADSIAKTSPLSQIIVKRVFPEEPPAGEQMDWVQFVKDATISDWHPVGTCAMRGGPGGSSKGVVDEKLKVYGVKNLRVVDASIIPIQISSHLQGTVYAIAEKGANLILTDYYCKRGISQWYCPA